MKALLKSVKVWCRMTEWHGRHAWVEIDDDDEPIGEWAICLGTRRNGKPEWGQLS